MTGFRLSVPERQNSASFYAGLRALWLNWATYLFTLLFILAGSLLFLEKHAAFATRTYDFARFAQALWNTLHGRFFYTSISNNNILGNHFSPLIGLYAPLLLIWQDVRVLLIGQVVVVALTGLILSRIVADRHPALAPLFLLAFFLNPYVHEVMLFEFRRVVPAMPFIALASLALTRKQYRLMAAALLMTLLGQEDMGLVVSAFGVYLLLFERQWRWGLPFLVGGLAWTALVSLWVIPSIGIPGREEGVYPQLFYFAHLGDSYADILTTLRHNPGQILGQIFTTERLAALGRFFVPLGIALPFLTPGFALMILPILAYLFLSNDPDMYLLEKWYTAPMLPILFAAIAMGLARLSARWAGWLTALLLLMTAVGFFQSSPAPGGGRYVPEWYTVTDHHHIAAALTAAVPPEAIVASQPPIIPHLALREDIYHFPWTTRMALEEMEYLVLDRAADAHPYNPTEINAIITDLAADPTAVIRLEGDGVYLFEPDGAPLEGYAVDRVAEGTMRLVRVELALKGADGLYRPVFETPLTLERGGELRVDLYWEAVGAPNAERTVSVRVVDGNGRLAAQHDGWPVQATKPTSWWQPGWSLRDSHYLTIDGQTAPGPASLDLLLYDSYSQAIVPFDGGQEILNLLPLLIGE